MKAKILQLRKLGYSYNRISQELNCSKGTISYHIGEKGVYKKSKIPKTICPLCRNKKDSKAITCHNCKLERTFTIQENRTLEDITSKGNARVKWSHLRGLAHKKMKINNIEKKCKICGFDDAVELCHIKPISSFNKKSKVKDINSLNNLIYLCPNHHVLLDKGKLNTVLWCNW